MKFISYLLKDKNSTETLCGDQWQYWQNSQVNIKDTTYKDPEPHVDKVYLCTNCHELAIWPEEEKAND